MYKMPVGIYGGGWSVCELQWGCVQLYIWERDLRAVRKRRVVGSVGRSDINFDLFYELTFKQTTIIDNESIMNL